MASRTRTTSLGPTRYEYRVWGNHKKARRILADLADRVSEEEYEDCYFLVDEPSINAKVRDRTLKVKELVGSERGFERWRSRRYRTRSAAPAPFDELFGDIRRHQKRRGDDFDIEKAVAGLDDDDARPVVVTKRRRRYELGAIRAEVTDLTVAETGEQLRTLAIEGEDLDALVALRKRLGLKGVDNVAVHVAIDDAEAS